MANITKRTSKKIGDRLEPGEEIRVAILVEPKGTYGKGLFPLAAAPGLVMRRQTKKAQEERAESEGMAAGFPAKSAVVAVTNQRILAVHSNGLQFKETVMDIPLGSMLVGEVSKSGIGRRLQFVFADGTSVAVDAQRAQPIDELTDTLGRAN